MDAMKKQWTRRNSEVALLVFVALVCCVVGMVIQLLVLSGVDENPVTKNFPFGVLVFVIGVILTHVIYNALSLVQEFNLAISMSATRRQFVASYVGFSVLELLGLLLFAFLLQTLEGFICQMLNPGIPFFALLSWETLPIVLLVMAGMIAVEMLMGALILRFGYKVLWAVWVLVMLPSFADLLSRWKIVARFLQSLRDLVVSVAEGLGIQWIVMVVVIAEATALAVSYCLMRRQRVTL